MNCPKCSSSLIKEDNVIFCSNCFKVIPVADYVEDKPLKREKIKPVYEREVRVFSKPQNEVVLSNKVRSKGWPKWRQKGIIAKINREWEPGKRLVFNPTKKKIKSKIVISKNGKPYYTTYTKKEEGIFRRDWQRA